MGGHPLYLALVAALSVALSIRGMTRGDVGLRAAQLSFLAGAAWMLFSKERWFPPGMSIFALVTWAGSGWILGLLTHVVITRLGRRLPRPTASHSSPHVQGR